MSVKKFKHIIKGFCSHKLKKIYEENPNIAISNIITIARI